MHIKGTKFQNHIIVDMCYSQCYNIWCFIVESRHAMAKAVQTLTSVVQERYGQPRVSISRTCLRRKEQTDTEVSLYRITFVKWNFKQIIL